MNCVDFFRGSLIAALGPNKQEPASAGSCFSRRMPIIRPMPIRVKARRGASAPAPKVPPFGLPAPPPGWPQAQPGISVCMIVKNEERFLEQCLRSIADVVDEINVVDTGSTDRTVDIARQFGARVEHRPWCNDFAWARNESLKMATKRWIFQLDADEELLPESKSALLLLKNAPAYNMGVWLRCVNASDKYRGGGNVSHAIVRLFPNNERIRFRGAIHEFPSLDDAPVGLPGVTAPIKILHHGYLSEVVNDRGKFARNLEIVEASIERDPEEAFHWYNLGMTAHLGGDQDRGIEGFERMWQLCKEHGMRAFTPNGLQTLADIYTEHKNEPEKGLHYALECLQLSPRYANAHFAAGKALVALGRLEEAREMYRCAIADGEHVAKQYVVDDEVPAWKAQCEIGGTYVAQGEDALALEWFDRGLANRPKVQPLRMNRAAALETLHANRGEAGEHLQHAHEALTRNAFEEALQHARDGFALAPNHEGLAYYAAIAAANLSRKEEAVRYLLHLENNGRVLGESACMLKAALLRELGRPQEALAAAERAALVNPQNVDAKLLRAALLEALSRTDDAERVLREALSVAKHRAAVELAGLYLRSGRVDDAKRVAEQALA